MVDSGTEFISGSFVATHASDKYTSCGKKGKKNFSSPTHQNARFAVSQILLEFMNPLLKTHGCRKPCYHVFLPFMVGFSMLIYQGGKVKNNIYLHLLVTFYGIHVGKSNIFPWMVWLMVRDFVAKERLRPYREHLQTLFRSFFLPVNLNFIGKMLVPLGGV